MHRFAPNPSPREKVARPSASEEIAGRKRNAGSNLIISTTKQTSTQDEIQVEVFKFLVISVRRPHSSSVRKTVPKSRFSDSFSPGEAVWCKLQHFPNILLATAWHMDTYAFLYSSFFVCIREYVRRSARPGRNRGRPCSLRRTSRSS